MLLHTAISLVTPYASGDLPPLEALQRTSDRYFTGLLVSSALVGLGVLMEFPQGLKDIGRWLRLRRGVAMEPDEKSMTVAISFLGLLFVIVGVAGEGIFEGLVSRTETRVRDYQFDIAYDAENTAIDSQLDIAMVMPRAYELFKGLDKQDSKNARKSLPKQRIDILDCTQARGFDRESSDYVQSLFEELNGYGQIAPPPVTVPSSNCVGRGARVHTSGSNEDSWDIVNLLVGFQIDNGPVSPDDKPSEFSCSLRSALMPKRYLWGPKWIVVPPCTPNTLVIVVYLQKF